MTIVEALLDDDDNSMIFFHVDRILSVVSFAVHDDIDVPCKENQCVVINVSVVLKVCGQVSLFRLSATGDVGRIIV